MSRSKERVPITLSIHRERFAIDGVFTIARGSRTQAEVLSVTLQADGATGRGECLPYARYGETLDSVAAQIDRLRPALLGGLDRLGLQALLPAGAARNALDCALWDLEARRAGMRAWQLAGLSEPRPLVTAYTLSLDDPEAMQASATRQADRPLLKVKLGGVGDLARLEAVRRGAPDSALIIDANEGWSVADYAALAPRLLALGVTMVEQPFPADDDAALSTLERSLPVCADESCHDRASLERLADRYDMINIKLDKAGGLTEALALRDEARRRGLGVMVGCMVASSLAMAPAMLVAQGADIVDLDGPLLLAEDRDSPLLYHGSDVSPSTPALWG